MLALMNEVVIAAGTESLAISIRNFVAPILLVVISIIGITFIVRREMTQFITFIIISIVVLALFYSPEILKTLALTFSSETGLAG